MKRRDRAVSQLLWTEKDREVWFSLGENHEKACRSPDFLRRSTGREQLCATFFTESRIELRGSTNLYRKSGFGLHQLLNCSSLFAAALLLAGCTVGPNYHRPTAPGAPAFKESAVPIPPPNPPNGGWKQVAPNDSAIRPNWWEIYQDPELNKLEQQVAGSNQTLKASYEQYMQARAAIQVCPCAVLSHVASRSGGFAGPRVDQSSPAR